MTRAAVLFALSAAVVSSAPHAQIQSSSDPFLPLEPGITFNDEERQQLDSREIVLKVLPASGHELAVVAAGSLKVGRGQLTAKVENIAELKRGRLVPEIGRFSPEPRLADLAGLTLDDVDVDAIKQCRPDHCALKLSADEIRRLQRAVSVRGSTSGLNQEFRRIILKRVKSYLASGLGGIRAYDAGDHADLVSSFTTLLRHSAFVTTTLPQLGEYLERYPHGPRPHGEVKSFLYWSKEHYAWKPIISVTHVTIVRPDEPSLELVVSSREVFATRYTSGALILTLLLRGSTPEAEHYLVYVNRTWVDGVRALWRPFVEHRIKGEAAKIFMAARDRIETPDIAHHPSR